MKLDDYRESGNVEQDRGGGGGGLGGGGGGIGLLFALVGSRFGIGGIIVLGLGMFLFGMNPLSLLGGGGGTQQAQHTSQTAQQVCDADAAHKFSCQVLASTEDTWTKLFQQRGALYRPATLHFYDRQGSSGCGVAQSAMGPFYCPTDQRVYLDTEFFNELSNRFHAAGDFAQAYVIAHEVGHHVQNLLGIAARVDAQRGRVSQSAYNALSVRLELQADCFAGVWANRTDRTKHFLDPGDVDEAVKAATAIGDDALQKQAQGYAVPDSFTHGTSAQRVRWLRQGLGSGDMNACDTFRASQL